MVTIWGVQEGSQCWGFRLSLGTSGGGLSLGLCLPLMARIVGMKYYLPLVDCESIHLLHKERVWVYSKCCGFMGTGWILFTTNREGILVLPTAIAILQHPTLWLHCWLNEWVANKWEIIAWLWFTAPERHINQGDNFSTIHSNSYLCNELTPKDINFGVEWTWRGGFNLPTSKFSFICSPK